MNSTFEGTQYIMKFSHRIKAETGLHGRAAARIVDKCKEYNSDISIIYNGRIGETDSIISLTALQARQGNTLNIIIDGDDEVLVYNNFKNFLVETL